MYAAEGVSFSGYFASIRPSSALRPFGHHPPHCTPCANAQSRAARSRAGLSAGNDLRNSFHHSQNGLHVRRLSSAFRLTDYCNSCFYELLLSTTKKGGTSAINRENLLPGQFSQGNSMGTPRSYRV